MPVPVVWISAKTRPLSGPCTSNSPDSYRITYSEAPTKTESVLPSLGSVLIAAPVREGKADVERNEVTSDSEIFSIDTSLRVLVFIEISVSVADPFILPESVNTVFAAARRNPSGLA